MRQIVLDTETTGLNPEQGHRIIEIGCVELINRRMTGKHFHTYLNPLRPIDEGAQAVHGITLDFLQDKPTFDKIIDDFLLFLQGAELIIHNAVFDLGFLDSELTRFYGKNHPLKTNLSVIDTLLLARKKFPGQKNNLDALCKRYNVDNKDRTLHGALLDAQLLSHVYLRLTSGQTDMFIEVAECEVNEMAQEMMPLPQDLPVVFASTEELQAHQDYLKNMEKLAKKPPLWWLLEDYNG